MFSASLRLQARNLLRSCRERGLRIATAESCTGGLMAALLTEIPGSSDVFERGFVTYSNEAKTESLGVPAALIAAHGAVSGQVAEAMAEGALKRSRADLAMAVTGIAGPGGGSAEKPVGLVWLAISSKEKTRAEKCLFSGGRSEIRLAALLKGLELLTVILGEA